MASRDAHDSHLERCQRKRARERSGVLITSVFSSNRASTSSSSSSRSAGLLTGAANEPGRRRTFTWCARCVPCQIVTSSRPRESESTVRIDGNTRMTSTSGCGGGFEMSIPNGFEGLPFSSGLGSPSLGSVHCKHRHKHKHMLQLAKPRLRANLAHQCRRTRERGRRRSGLD